jgi:hypothetical protein
MRLRSQLLAGERAGSPAEVARHFLAVQAQDFPASRWALGLRCGSGEASVGQAYRDGEIVRSWPMRGTLHAVPAEDLGWLQPLTSARVLGATAEGRRVRLGLDRAVIEQVREGVTAALAGGRALNRDALFAELAAGGLAVEASWKYHLVWFLAQTGTLVFGPVAGGEPLLVLADRWIGRPRNLGRDEALAELAARYVASHGPATSDDLAWWAGLGKRAAARALALAGDRVARLEVSGAAYWVSPALADAARPPSRRRLALLPAFDEYLLGYRDRSAVLDPAFAPLVCPGGNGVFKPVVVVDGVVAGTWSAAPRGALARLAPDRPVPISVAWFDQAPQNQADPADLQAAADVYARYLGRERAQVTQTTAPRLPRQAPV